MLMLGSLLAGIGLIVFAFGLYGRAARRGRFCRKCRFDVDAVMASNVSACPECGSSLDHAGAILDTLRHRSRGLLALAGVLIIIGAAIAAAGASIGTTRLVAMLPAHMVVALADRGVDDAMTELSTRSLAVPCPFDDGEWQAAIELALKRQADTTITWDPRFGDVLAAALFAGKMDETQLERYFSQGIEDRVVIRDRVNRRDADVWYSVLHNADRLALGSRSMTGTSTGLSIRRTFIDKGLVGRDAKPFPSGSSTSGLYLPGGPGLSAGRSGSAIDIHPDWWDDSGSNQQLRVFVEYQIDVLNSDGSVLASLGRRRSEQDVRLLPEGTPIVAAMRNPAKEQAAALALSISELVWRPTQANDETGDSGRLPPDCFVYAAPFDLPFAGRLFARFGEKEIEISPLVIAGARTLTLALHIGWYPDSHLDSELFASANAAWLSEGSVDLIFRTEPDVAESDPTINEVLNVTLIFENVPFRVGQTAPGARARIPARLLDKP